MAWPKLRNRRSPGGDRNGTALEPSSKDPAREQSAWPRPGWPGPGAAVVRSGAAAPAQGPGPATAEPSETAPDPADVPFWAWGTPADPAGFDDSSDELPPDRPEYPDGPDPEYQAAAGHGARTSPRVVITPVGAAGDEREGIGEHLGNLAHLSGNPRMRIWQRRVVIAVIVGVAFGIAVNWQLGLTLAIVAAIIDTVVRSRTVFNGPGGVRLTKAQRRTVRQLAKMERRGYRAMHIVPIPNSEEQIDHLVVGPAGVFAIDSEDWDRRMPVRTSSHRQLWHGPTSKKDRLMHAHWEAGQAAERISAALGSPVSVRPTMAVYGPKIPWDVAEIRDVDVFSGPKLKRYLKRRARQAGNERLSRGEIERIDKAAHIAFPTEPAG